MSMLLEVQSLRVSYGGVVALDGVDLDVEDGMAVALLGPSGSGKTTLLHSIAGFVPPDGGRILIDGVEAASPHRMIPPERRPVAMMFQHYALWPHLTAWENVAFPLRRQGRGSGAARSEALALMRRLGLEQLAERRPAELSGGQQQRVALARALARNARLFMFDEPTAHLDAGLKETILQEIALRRREVGAGAIYATHDATEALAIADLVALMRNGVVVQVGSPTEVYERPIDLWAALLTGPASVVDLTVLSVGADGATVDIRGQAVSARVEGAGRPGRYRAVLRPEWLDLDGDLPGVVRGVWYRGSHTDYLLDTPLGPIGVRTPGTPRVAPGIAVGWTLNRAWVGGASGESLVTE